MSINKSILVVFILTLGMGLVAPIGAEEGASEKQEDTIYDKNKSEINNDTRTWNGFNVGINLGGLFGNSNGSFFPKGSESLPSYSCKFKGIGATVGAQVGYNYQIKKFVCGIETDFNYSSIHSRHSNSIVLENQALGNFKYGFTHRLEWFGTLRPRIGIGFDYIHLYVTGGFAYGSIKSHTNISFTQRAGSYSKEKIKTLIGWTAGCGIGYNFSKNKILKLEYLYVDLERYRYSVLPSIVVPIVGITYASRLKTIFNCLRIGIDYKL